MDALNDIIKSSSSMVWRGLSSVWPSGTPSGDQIMSKAGQPLIASQIKLSEIATRREVLAILQTSGWTRLAGLLGATAVAMGAYGAHGTYYCFIDFSFFFMLTI